MPLTVAERELLRNLVKNFIVKNPNANKSKIVNHFVQTSFARRTIYNTLDKLSTTSSINDNKRTGRPSSWTADKKDKLKRLTNNLKGVSQRKLARKFNVCQTNISAQLARIKIKCQKREKTPKYSKLTLVSSFFPCKDIAFYF